MFKNLRPDQNGLITLPSEQLLIVVKGNGLYSPEELMGIHKASDLSTFGVVRAEVDDLKKNEIISLDTMRNEIVQKLRDFEASKKVRIELDCVRKVFDLGNLFVVRNGSFSVICRFCGAR